MNIASYIDHTQLKPDTNITQIEKLCKEALLHNFAAVCVPPYYTSHCKEFLDGSDVHIATVIAFPFGYTSPVSKFSEADECLQAGANELDVVLNLAALKSNQLNIIEEELRFMKTACMDQGTVFKYIIECGMLTAEEFKTILKLCNQYKPDFVKTSTGIMSRGAELNDILIMRKHLSKNIGIKASGGIKNKEQAAEMITAGATRIGTSHGISIISN